MQRDDGGGGGGGGGAGGGTLCAGAAGPPRPRPPGRPPRTRMVRIKVISLGDVGVGKSCIIKRYCEGKFVARYIPTIGVDFGVKPVRVNLWDMAGAPEYFEVRNEFYRDTQGALLVFDATSRQSFESLAGWLDEAAANGAPPGMAVVVAATKCDAAAGPRRVGEREARDWAAERGFGYFEVSAQTGASVAALFASLFAQVLASTANVPVDAVARAAEAAADAAAGGGDGGGCGGDDTIRGGEP
ncbi:hypothetical protein Rsub_04355 [Raphidocelis subcapitata]|uniref:Uncharacterized protein n=1 Tax=Raphidocelis subcapitata TaxID=307507 RepID=A0A2V0P3G0_9CHLO|nr:hypothetical protein Rsub_04355 [Raphidocelis subcapitata]|eukprot:GBF91615.1 hypothetical protein Rsub_04355 [Raphidocelis subcapitata]